MKPKPRPIKELIVDKKLHCIFLSYASNDALDFIRKEASKYGDLMELPYLKLCTLSVFRSYDMHEVAEYLESYNEKC